jgi:hypothetical protein
MPFIKHTDCIFKKIAATKDGEVVIIVVCQAQDQKILSILSCIVLIMDSILLRG